MLYALRYQKTQTANIASLINFLLANGVSREEAKVSCLFLQMDPAYVLCS